MYGLLNFPFLVFLFPYSTEMLTNSRATAYDSEGNTVPLYVTSFTYEKQHGVY